MMDLISQYSNFIQSNWFMVSISIVIFITGITLIVQVFAWLTPFKEDDEIVSIWAQRWISFLLTLPVIGTHAETKKMIKRMHFMNGKLNEKPAPFKRTRRDE